MRIRALILMLMLSLAGVVRGQSNVGGGNTGGSNTPGTPGAMPQFASYTFYINGSTVNARNNLTGAIDFSGTDAAVVFNGVLTANATVGGHIYFKNGVYPVNSLTAETATGCSSFGGSGNLLAYAFGFPASASYQTGAQWFVEGEASSIWTGELLSTTVAATGVVFNITPTAVSSVAANSVLAGFWQRPFTNCALTTAVNNNNANDLYFKNITLRFPVNTRGNEIAYAVYFAGDIQYENVLADFNVGYNTIATGSAPTVGSYNSIGFTTTTSGSGNWEDFRQTYAVGYNIGYDFQSEHVTGTTVTAIYNNIPCEFGRSAGSVYHPSKIDNFVDQENAAGCIWGNQIQQGTFFDIYFDFELGNDANWYSTARGKIAKLVETPNFGYATGIIRYQAVLQNAGVVAEIPATSLFTSGGTGFQAFEATNPPSIAITPISDTFTRPNTTPAGASNGLGPAWQGGTQAGNHNLKIVSNSAQVTDTGIQSGYSTYLATSFNPDQFSKATCSILVAAANFCEVTVRNSTNPAVQTYYTYYDGGTNAAGRGIIKVVAGVSTTLASQTSAAGAAGDTIELDVVGNTLWAYRNGALDTSFTNPVSDSSITSGNPGINLVQAATNGVAATNWLGGSFPTKTGTDSIYNNPGYHTTYNTITNCAVNSVSPAACGSAPVGVVVIPTTTTTYTVNTSAVTASSRIILQPINDNTGIPSSPTCTTLAVTSVLMPASRVAGTSFTFNIPSTVGSSCVEYWIVN